MGAADRPVVLVAASRPEVRRLVRAALQPHGFAVTTASDGRLDDALLADASPDLVMVDALTAEDAALIATRPRRSRDPVPVMVLGARSTPEAAVHALDAGADDYVGGSFSATELAARVRSLVRRRGPSLASGRYRIGDVIVDLEGRVVESASGQTSLTRTEWRLLLRLLADQGRVLTHDELLISALGWEFRGDLASLREAVGRLRRKLGARPGSEGPIRTVRGLGYRLEAPET